MAGIQKQILRPAGTARKATAMRAAIPDVQPVSKALSRVFSMYDLRVAHLPASKLRNKLLNVKDKLKSEKFTGVMDTIRSADCNCVSETVKFPRRLRASTSCSQTISYDECASR